jgi:hypothetical protein
MIKPKFVDKEALVFFELLLVKEIRHPVALHYVDYVNLIVHPFHMLFMLFKPFYSLFVTFFVIKEPAAKY